MPAIHHGRDHQVFAAAMVVGDNGPVPEPADRDVTDRLRRDQAGLVPAIVQQYDTGEVLMLAWMNDEALTRTLRTGLATYWSRSRAEYWVKGATSGNYQHVKEVRLDCDGDTLLVKVDSPGPACHTGARTCFDGDRLDRGRLDRGESAT